MNSLNQPSGEEQLGDLIRESRPEACLPPRFQENVWRRIEQAESKTSPAGWIEMLAALVLKPRFVVATVCTLVLAGAWLGTMDGSAHARQTAQDRYVASVAMTMVP